MNVQADAQQKRVDGRDSLTTQVAPFVGEAKGLVRYIVTPICRGSVPTNAYHHLFKLENTMSDKRQRAIELARQAAYENRGKHDYLPNDAEAIEYFQPHEWVVDAIEKALVERRNEFTGSGNQ